MSPSKDANARPKPQRRFFLLNKRKSQPTPGGADAAPSPSPSPPNLAVQVNVKFAAPLDYGHENVYRPSATFQPTDDICQALSRRIDLGCTELISRKDSTALSNRSGQRPLRFEVTFTITRAGKTWAAKSFKSYQKLPVDGRAASEIFVATDQLVGLFLKRHDRNYAWHPKEHASTGSETVHPSSSIPVSLASVPHFRFDSSRQDYEVVPGYEIALTFRSRCHSRYPANWHRRVVVKSRQSNPLTLALGEDLTWRISKEMNDLLDARKRLLRQQLGDDEDDMDEACLEEDALHVDFSVRNSLGTDYTHFSRSVDTRLALFQHPDALDCLRFIADLDHAMTGARDESDAALGQSADLKISVRKLSGLSGAYWTIKNPFAVSLDSSICYSRRTTQAILDRVQTGIADTLRGRDASITLHATKRGHTVLDKTLSARADPSLPDQTVDPRTEQRALIATLKDRIREDVAMIIRDTCALDDNETTPRSPPNLRLRERRTTHFRPPTPLALPELVTAKPQPQEPVSMDDLIARSLSLFAELDEESPDALTETPTAANPDSSSAKIQLHPETPTRRIFWDHGQRPSVESTTVARDSASAAGISFTMSSDGADSDSTRFSTPSLSDHDATETPFESCANTPPSMQRAWKHDQSDQSNRSTTRKTSSVMDVRPAAAPAKEPRKFSLLGRHHRPRTPVVSRIEDDKSSATESSEEGWLGYSCEPVGEPEHATEAPLPEEVSAPGELEGWLGYCSEPDKVTPAEVESVAGPPVEETRPVTANSETNTRDPEPPQTPAMTDDDGYSDADDSLNITPAPFPELGRPAIQASPSTPSNSLSQWHHATSSRPRSAGFLLDDFDSHSAHAPETPSKPARHAASALQPRPQSAHAISLLANPWSLSPPAPMRTPQARKLGTHRRQLSGPTAGYLGLLHGSPLWRQACAYQQQQQQQQQKQRQNQGEDGTEARMRAGSNGSELQERRQSGSFWEGFWNQYESHHQRSRSNSGVGTQQPSTPNGRPSSSMGFVGLGPPSPSLRPLANRRDSGFWDHQRSRSGTASSSGSFGGRSGGLNQHPQPRVVGGALGAAILLN